MKIAFLWTGFTSYMADCWRELAAREGIELKIWIEEIKKSDTGFNPEALMRGLDYTWHFSEQIGETEREATVSQIAAFAPDVLFICGWARKLPPHIAARKEFANVPKVLCCDMPWEWKPRKFAARFVLWRHLRRFRKIMMPGKRAAMYGRWLGFKDSDIVRGEYGIDTERFARVPAAKVRRGFVFVGRLTTAKDIRTLAEAYRLYRAAGGDWPLDVYGIGDEKKWLDGIDGLTVHGFVQPDELPQIYARAGAFVIASVWDPWPLVILESCAAGLPVICTENCWDRYELIRENGIVVKARDPKVLAAAMARVPELDGEKGRSLAAAYSTSRWADCITALVQELTNA